MFRRSILAAAALLVAMPSAFAGNFVDLTVGHSHVVRADGALATVIIGDDSIADANIGSGNTIILTGKALGSTNLIVLDEAGSEIMSSTLKVGPVDRRPTTNVRILKGGVSDQNYVCGPGSGCAPSNSGNAVAATLAGVFQDQAASASTDGVEGEEQPQQQQ